MRSQPARYCLCAHAKIKHSIPPCRRGGWLCRCDAFRLHPAHHGQAEIGSYHAAILKIPGFFPSSWKVDWLHLLAGIRPVIRTRLREQGSTRAAVRWVRRQGFVCVVDDEGFIVVARKSYRARRAMAIDRSVGNHTRTLGLALGYPECCCREAAKRGDSQLDQWAETYSRIRLSGVSKVLNPIRYFEGESVLSHIPCSPRCKKSLQMAQLVLRFRHQPHGTKVREGV